MLGTTAEIRNGANKTTSEIDNKNQIDLYPHMYFTEHLVDAFEKSPCKSNLNH
jgi:hypothetical protein